MEETDSYVNPFRLSVSYIANQRTAVPDMPYQFDQRLLRMVWSVVSNAADRSSRVSAVALTLSMLWLMLFCTFKRTVSLK